MKANNDLKSESYQITLSKGNVFQLRGLGRLVHSDAPFESNLKFEYSAIGLLPLSNAPLFYRKSYLVVIRIDKDGFSLDNAGPVCWRPYFAVKRIIQPYASVKEEGRSGLQNKNCGPRECGADIRGKH